MCLGVLALGLAIAAPAAAQPQNSGYISVSRTQIDPGMIVMTDEDPPKQEQTASQDRAPPSHGQPGAGVPLDQLGADGDADAPAGDDPLSDDATQTDAVYTA
jgi:hypothetical protein